MQSEKARPLPKFGEWDVNNPASADGFTVIFAKARDEKKGSGNPAARPPPAPTPTPTPADDHLPTVRSLPNLSMHFYFYWNEYSFRFQNSYPEID